MVSHEYIGSRSSFSRGPVASHEESVGRLDSQGGFLLPVVAAMLVILSISLAGALSFVTSEARVVDNVTSQDAAFRVAQRGLNTFLANRAGLGFASNPPAALEEVDIPIENGTAEVVLERIRPAVGTSGPLYVVRSTGVIPGPRPIDPPARRTVAQVATYETGTMSVRAGWASLTGLHKNGAAGSISGVDQCGMQPNIAGVSVPNPPGLTTSGPFTPTGAPQIENFPNVQAQIDSLGIDWEGIRNMTSITPDIVIPGGSWPSFSNPNYWPVIHVTGNYSLPGTGRGVLIVTGNLSISGNKTWNGIVLVGTHLTSNGNNKVYGATISGLDAMLQPDPQAWATAQGKNAVGNGNKTYQYNSCHIASALSSFGGFSPVENAWVDNWPVD